MLFYFLPFYILIGKNNHFPKQANNPRAFFPKIIRVAATQEKQHNKPNSDFVTLLFCYFVINGIFHVSVMLQIYNKIINIYIIN